ncbi:hypothetical protein VTN96DRAFT_2756 [Rasamsonia emersonii]
MPTSVPVWYCCQCNYGPLNIVIDAACASCQAPRCDGCTVEMVCPKYAFCGGDDEGTSPYPGVPSIFDPSNSNMEHRHRAATDEVLSLASSSQFPAPSLLRRSGARDMTRGGRQHGQGIVTHGPKTFMYYCCQCRDGPKVYNHQVVCVNCNHVVCDNCIPAER